jgi:hypothetical protein
MTGRGCNQHDQAQVPKAKILLTNINYETFMEAKNFMEDIAVNEHE